MNLSILVDCDNVLSDITGSFIQLAADKFNVFATREQHTEEEFGPSIGCPGLEYAIDEAVLHHEFCYRMKLLPGAEAFFRTLEDTYGKDNVYACTKPWRGDHREKATGEWASQRYAWLRDKLGISRSRVHMCAAKHMVQGILIDDSVKNLDKRAAGEAFCIAYPYNKAYTGPRGGYAECLVWLKETVK